jgi:hypothetical protein
MSSLLRPSKVALVVLALVLAGCASPVSPAASASPGPSSPAFRPSTSPIASPSLAIATPVAPSPSAIGPQVGWQRVRLPRQPAIADIMDIDAGPTAIVAVGGSPPTGAAAAWSSIDGGTTWAAEPVPADNRSPNRVVAWADRFLAAGAGEFRCPHPYALETWIRAADGAWAAAPDAPLFCVGGSANVAVHGGTVVLSGIGSGDVPFLWSSSDGLHWTDRSGRLPPNSAPQALISDGSGFTVFGGSQTGPWDLQSADGTSWQAEALPGNERVTILAAFSRNGQAAAFAETGGAIGVYSRDSSGAWETEPATGLDTTKIGRIVAVDGGLVAVGGGEVGPSVWVSADGTAWRSIGLPPDSDPGTNLTGALVSGGHAFLIGQTPTGGQAEGVIWEGPAALLAP